MKTQNYEKVIHHSSNGLSYYVTVVGAEKSYVLQILTDGTIDVFKKMKN
jgi:hypothetical protein